jgi:pimeloyl-ACP methyl ester carboxylesterase
VASSMSVTEQFVDVDARNVFVRVAGRGPALVLLHQSPQSSRALVPWIERLAGRYAVFAPDTPGFGFSDPLPLAQPTIPDYARALAALFDVLGIKKAIVYGVHTGAVTALRFALDFSDRVALLVCDGYARFDATERQRLLDGYLPPFEPSWDGTHLLWLWARFREQNLFFPWNVPTREARLSYPAPTTVKLNSDVCDVLDAGDGYRAGYRAPFLYDDATAAARLTVSARIFYRAEDVLASHLPRLPALPHQVHAARIEGGPAALVTACDDAFAEHAKDAMLIDAAEAVVHAASSRRFVMQTANGTLGMHARDAPNAHATPTATISSAEIVLGDIGSPAQIPVDAASELSLLCPEWPGHGVSRGWGDALSSSAVILDQLAEEIANVARTRGFEHITVRATGGAAALGVMVCMRLGERCRMLSLRDPLVLNAEERELFLAGLPDSAPHATGAHLVAAWNWARMKHLFWPWLPSDGKSARRVDAPAPSRVHAEVVEMVRAGPLFASLWAAVLEYDVASALRRLSCSIEVISTDEPERMRIAARLANQSGLVSLPRAGSGSPRWQSPN